MFERVSALSGLSRSKLWNTYRRMNHISTHLQCKRLQSWQKQKLARKKIRFWKNPCSNSHVENRKKMRLIFNHSRDKMSIHHVAGQHKHNMGIYSFVFRTERCPYASPPPENCISVHVKTNTYLYEPSICTPLSILNTIPSAVNKNKIKSKLHSTLFWLNVQSDRGSHVTKLDVGRKVWR